MAAELVDKSYPRLPNDRQCATLPLLHEQLCSDVRQMRAFNVVQSQAGPFKPGFRRDELDKALKGTAGVEWCY